MTMTMKSRGRRNDDGDDEDYDDDDDDNAMISLKMTMERRLIGTRITTTMRMPKVTSITAKRSLMTMRIKTAAVATATP